MTTMKMTLGRKVTKMTMRRRWRRSRRKCLEGDKASGARCDSPRSLPHERPSPGDEGNVVDVDGHFAIVVVVVDEAGDDGGDGDAAIRLPPRCP